MAAEATGTTNVDHCGLRWRGVIVARREHRRWEPSEAGRVFFETLEAARVGAVTTTRGHPTRAGASFD
jgi:hypothetical protein